MNLIMCNQQLLGDEVIRTTPFPCATVEMKDIHGWLRIRLGVQEIFSGPMKLRHIPTDTEMRPLIGPYGL